VPAHFFRDDKRITAALWSYYNPQFLGVKIGPADHHPVARRHDYALIENSIEYVDKADVVEAGLKVRIHRSPSVSFDVLAARNDSPKKLVNAKTDNLATDDTDRTDFAQIKLK
jgi:hypothetical protein